MEKYTDTAIHETWLFFFRDSEVQAVADMTALSS